MLALLLVYAFSVCSARQGAFLILVARDHSGITRIDSDLDEADRCPDACPVYHSGSYWH